MIITQTIRQTVTKNAQILVVLKHWKEKQTKYSGISTDRACDTSVIQYQLITVNNYNISVRGDSSNYL